MDFEKAAAAFMEGVRRAGRRGAGRRYPAELRRREAAYLAARRAAGGTVSAVVREIGIQRDTLAGWAQPVGSAVAPRFVPVTVVEATTGRIVLHGPHGGKRPVNRTCRA
ncbi:MAG: hypothetical protein QM767_02890 [Anaeromyxobacter sp.]